MAILLLLAGLTLLAYHGVFSLNFVHYDDNEYVTENPYVQLGLSEAGVAWAFTTLYAANWHPLTWLSLQMDTTLLGGAAGGYHFTNLLLHLANTLLLYCILQRMTKAALPSALVAALFAIHPLHVESVAWIAERKDVLSTLFWMLTLWAYYRYVQRRHWQRYLLVLLVFGLGLMAKPMLVTLPCVLLLLDYWPLQRLSIRTAHDSAAPDSARVREAFQILVLEKLPLFALSGLACAATIFAQSSGNTVQSISENPLASRFANAAIAYLVYVKKTLLPYDLAAFYPHPGIDISYLHALGAIVLLVAVTVYCVHFRKRRPYLLVGWLWFLGTLVPVIGIVQVGDQALADRYTYVPLIGLFLATSWSLWELRRIVDKRFSVALITGLLLACLVTTWNQVTSWQDGETLWRHALRVNEDNYLAHANLAVEFVRQGKQDQATEHATRSLTICPNAIGYLVLGNAMFQQRQYEQAESFYLKAREANVNFPNVYNNLGSVHAIYGDVDESISLFSHALELNPYYALAHHNLGLAWLRRGDFNLAHHHLLEAIRLNSENDDAIDNLGNTCFFQGNSSDAIENYRRAIKLRPDNVCYHCDLAMVLQAQGQHREARKEFALAHRLEPSWALQAARQAWRLSTHPSPKIRYPRKALQLAKQICEGVQPCPPVFLDCLATAHAACGQFKEAVKISRRALEFAETLKQKEVAEKIRVRLKSYERQHAYFETEVP